MFIPLPAVPLLLPADVISYISDIAAINPFQSGTLAYVTSSNCLSQGQEYD